MYFCLFETEGRTLEEIEEHYAGKDKCKVTSRNNKWFPQTNVFTPSVINTSDMTSIKKNSGKIRKLTNVT